MKYALNVGDGNRVLSATYEEYGTPQMPVVDSIPEGSVADYLYVNGEFVFEPLPVEEEHPSDFEIMQAQVLYTAIMTDTLIEE